MRILKSFIKQILCIGIILLSPIYLIAQDIRIDSFQGIAVPSPSIPDACPTANYDFGTVFTNTSAVTLTTSSATLKITVIGTNPATYYKDMPVSDVQSQTTFTVTQSISMINTGPNTVTAEVYLDDSPGTIIDSKVAEINVTRAAASPLNTPGITQSPRQQIVEILIGTATTGSTTETYSITLSGTTYTHTVTASTSRSADNIATALATLINAAAPYSSSNEGAPSGAPNKRIIRITAAVSGVSFNYSASSSGTLNFDSPNVIAGSQSVEICSDESIDFNTSGGVSYDFYVNNGSATGSTSNQNFTRNSKTNYVVYAKLTDSNGCERQTYPISVNVNLTPEDSGSSITVSGTGFTLFNDNESYKITISGSIDAGDTFSITTTGTTYTSSNTRTAANLAIDDLVTDLASSGYTIVDGGGDGSSAFLTITNPSAGSSFSVITASSDADSGASIGVERLKGSQGIVICEGSTQLIQASGATSYTFQVLGGSTTTASTTTLSSLQNGDIIKVTGFTGSGGTGCSSEIYISVDLNDISDAGTLSSNQTICYDGTPSNITGTSPTLGLTASLTYRWEKSTDGDSYSNLGVSTQNFQPPQLIESTYYRRAAISTYKGQSCEKFSNSVYINVESPESISFASGSTAQNVCVGTAIATITYNLSGGSVSATTISPTIISEMGLPDGIQVLQTTQSQLNTVNITSAAEGSYKLFIDSRPYVFNASASSSSQDIRNGLITLIQNDGLAKVTASTSGTTGINITADTPGLSFSNVTLGGTQSANMNTSNITPNLNKLEVFGTVNLSETPGVYSYTISTTGAAVCSTNSSTLGTITVKPTSTVSLTSSTSTDNQFVCINSAITPITYDILGATGATVSSPTALVVDGLPPGVTSGFSGGVLSITGTPSVTLVTETQFTYTVVTSGAVCSEATVSGTITVSPDQVISLVSSSTTTSQDICDPTAPITDIVYDLTGSAFTISPTLASMMGLPDGITANHSKVAQVDRINISGTATGTHRIAVNGEIFSFGDDTSRTATQIRDGLVAAINARTVSVTVSNNGTTAFDLTARVAGTPFKVNLGNDYESWNGSVNMTNTSITSNTNKYRIQGTLDPSVTAATYTYSITTSAGTDPTCTVTSSLTGTITLKESSTLVLTSTGVAGSDSQIVCNNSAISSITYTLGGGGTGAQVTDPTMVIDGLPTGVTGQYSSTTKKFIITGTPSVTIPYTTIFNYSVSSSGSSGCPEVVRTGTITVEPAEVIELSSASSYTTQTVCAGSAIESITYELKGSATQISPTIPLTFPSGITANANKLAQSNTVTVTGVAVGSYIIAVNGVMYSYNAVSGNTSKTIRDALFTAIDGSASASVTVAKVGDHTIILTSISNGVPFGINLGGTAGDSRMTNSITTSNTNEIIISGTIGSGVASGTYSYTISTTGANECTINDSLSGVFIVPSAKVSLTSSTSTDNQFVCINSAITPITYDILGATGATVSSPTALVVDGLPPGVTSGFSGGVLSITGTPSVTLVTETQFTYTVVTSGAVCSEATVSGTITVSPDQVISLVSSSTTTSQDICDPTAPITDIVYDLTGSAFTISPTLASMMGLPDGITANHSKVAQVDRINISGTATGTHRIAVNGEIFSFGDDTSRTATQIRDGLVAAINARTVSVTVSNNGTTAFDLTARVAGTPFKVNLGNDYESWNGSVNMTNTSITSNTNKYRIQGTLDPSVTAATYTYSITTSAGTDPTCTVTSSLTGTITLKESSTLVLTSTGVAGSDSQIVCNNSAISSITYTLGGGGTGAQVTDPTMVIDGLPTGVTGQYSSTTKKFIITGTPSVTIPYTTIFNYSVSSSGSSGCPEVVRTGTITVEPAEVIELSSASSYTTQTVCAGSAIESITYELKGSATQISPTIPLTFPSGITANANKLAQSNTVTVTGVAVGSYIIAVNGVMYSYNAVSGNTSKTIRDALFTAIDGSASASVTVAKVGDHTIILTSISNGVPFGINLGGTAGDSRMTNSITTSNTNEIIISGTIGSGVASGTYSYTISTTGANECTINDSLSGVINVSAASTITLISAAGTTTQTVCNNTAITNIDYNIVGSVSATVNPPTALVVDGLPNGVVGNYLGGGVFRISGTPSTTDIITTEYTYTIVTLSNTNGCSESQIQGTITVDPLQGGIINSGNNQVYCYDPSNPSSVPNALSVTGATAAASGVEYQWEISPDNSNWEDVPGATGASFTVGTVTQTTYYRRMTQRVSGGTIKCEVPSEVHKITVNAFDVGQIAMPEFICYNSIPNQLLSVKDATSVNGAITYQWQVSTNNINWTNIQNATSASYQPPGALTSSLYYRRQAISSVTNNINQITITGDVGTGKAFSMIINGTAITVVTGTTTKTKADALVASITADTSLPVDAANVNGVITLTPKVAGTTYTYSDSNNTGGTASMTAIDTTPNICSATTSSVLISVIDDINKANTVADQTICSGATPVDISATGVSNSPNFGNISNAWFGSTDNENFSALGGGYNNVNTTTLDPATALTQTTYFRIRSTNTYNIYPVQRITVSGNGAAIGETYKITVDAAATTSATFTTVTTVTLNSKITEGIANAINNTAGINDVVEAYDYQNGTIDIRGKVAGTAITITRTLGGSANASISAPSVIKSTSSTCFKDSNSATVIVSPIEDITQSGGPINQTVCRNDPIQAIDFEIAGGTADLVITPFSIDPSDNSKSNDEATTEPPYADASNSVNGITVNRIGGTLYRFSGNPTSGLSYTVKTESYQKDRINIVGAPKVGELYTVVINSFSITVTATTATVGSLVTLLTNAINNDARINNATTGVAATGDTGAGTITIVAHKEDTPYTIGFQNSLAQDISTIALTGTTNSNGEVYTIVINGVPYVSSPGTGIGAAAVATELSGFMDATDLISSTVAGSTITLEAEKRGVVLSIETYSSGNTPQVTFSTTSTQSATTSIGSNMSITPIWCAGCSDPSISGVIDVNQPVTPPVYIIANYPTGYDGVSGNMQLTSETMINDGGVRIYNGASCGTPEITDFDACGQSNAAGLQWSLTAGAGTIDINTGSVIWNPDFAGIATISVQTLGCNGPSGTKTQNIEVFAADPIQEHIFISASVAATDVVTVTVDGTSQGYTVTGAPLTVAATVESITTLINSSFGSSPFSLTATNVGNTHVKVTSSISSVTNFDISASISSTAATLNSVTVNSASTTLQTPSSPSEPSVLEQFQRQLIEITNNSGGTVNVPAGEVYRMKINGRCYEYTTTASATANDIQTSFISQINGATHTFRGSEGVTASSQNAGATYSSLRVTADYLGYSDYGTNFVVEFERIPVPNNAFSPAYNLSSYTQIASSRYVCGPNWNTHTGAQPNCEITDSTESTQFFAQSENYQYITWSLSSVNPGTGSPLTVIDNESNTTFTQQGILDWTSGFHGSFNLNATAIGCDGVTTSPLSTKSIVIASRAVTPTDIIVQGGSFLPSCPGSTASTQFYSDPGSGNSVTWSIDNNSAGVINCDTGVLTWNSDFSGTVNITATSTGCGAPSVTVPFNVPPNQTLTKTSAAGSEVQDVCVNTSLPVSITYNVTGGATGAYIPALSGTTGLPVGVTGTFSPTNMIYDVTVSGGGNAAASESFKIFISGKIYDYAVTGTPDKDAVATAIANLINADGLRIVNADAASTAGTIRLSAINPATYFSINLLENSTNLSMSTPTNPVQGVGVYIIEGTPTAPVSSPTRYNYTVLTTGSSCTPGTASGYIIVEPESLLTRTSVSGTQAQELCVGEDIVDLTLEVFNGATGASVPPLSGLTGLPEGVDQNFTPLNQTDDISFSGANSGSSTETYSIALSVNGGGSHTVTYTASPNSTLATVRSGVASAINQYVKLITITGQGTAINNSYTVTLTTDASRSAIFTAVTTITTNIQIASGLVSEINNTAGIQDVVEAMDMGNGSFKLFGKVIGTSIDNITSSVSGTGSIGSPVTLDLTSSISATITASGTVRVTGTNLGVPQSVIVVADPTIDLSVTPVRGTGVITISGTPSVTLNNTNIYNFTINSTGNIYSCDEDIYTGSIKLKPRERINHPTTIVSSTFSTTSATVNGLLNQVVCDGDELVGIRLDLSGSSVSASSAPLSLFTGLPPGIALTPNSTAQVRTTQVSGTMSSGDSFVININGVEYTYSTTVTKTYSEVVLGIVTSINTATGNRASPVTAKVSGTIIVLTADVPGISFSYTATSTNANSATNSSTLNSSVAGDIENDNYVTLTGDPDPVTTATTYYYTIQTTGTSCTPHATVTGTITLLAQPIVGLRTAPGTDSQEVCENSNIIPVSFKVYGGAVSLTTQNNSGFDRVPPGLTESYSDTNQSDEIIWSGPATAPVSETFGVQINETTYTVSTVIGETIITFIDRLVDKINNDVSINVTASSSSGSKLVLTADGAGAFQGYSVTPFTLAATSSYTLSRENISGTGLLTLSGSPDLSGLSPSANSPLTYTYVVESLGNVNSSCSVTSTTQSATITVIPAEQLNYSATITTTLFVGDTVSTTTNGELVQAVCEGGTIDGIRLEVEGSATAVTVAPLVGLNGIPPGISLTPYTASQVQTTKVSGTTLTAGEVFTIKINGISYEYTIANSSITSETAAQELVDEINNSTGTRLSPVTANTSGTTIILTADQPGKSFSYESLTSTTTIALDNSVAGDVANKNYVTITGSPSDSVSSTKTYTFDVTTVGTGCSPAGQQTISISILPNSKITLTSASGTDSQEVCNETDIIDITYEISNGAKNFVLESADFAQQDKITISGTFSAGDKVTVTIDELNYDHPVQAGQTSISNIINDLVPRLDANSSIFAIPDLTNNAIYLKAETPGGTYNLELATTTGTVTSTDITPNSTTSLPTGVNANKLNLQQEDVVSITGTFVAGEKVYIYVTGGNPVKTNTYSHTVASGALSETNVRDALISEINSNAGRRVDAISGPGAGELTLRAKISGDPFGLSQFTNSVTPTITSVNTVGSARITISGKPNSGSLFTTTYFYRLRTSENLLGCGDDVLQGSIKVSPPETITYDPSDSNFPGSDNAQQVCLGSAIDGIKFQLTGTSTGASIPTLVGTNGLPPGVLPNQVVVTQQNTLDITASSAIGAQYIIKIDGISYIFTTTDANGDGAVDQDASAIANGLSSKINTSSGNRLSNVTATTSSASIVLTADVQGIPFNLNFSGSGTIAGSGNIALASSGNIANENYFTIAGTPDGTGLPNPLTSAVSYTFTITTSGTSCLPHDTANGTITLIPGSTVVLSSGVSTTNQIVCATNAIDPIVYTIGGGATGLEEVTSSNTLEMLPPGINLGNGAVANTFQLIGSPTITVTTTTIYAYTLRTTGNPSCTEATIQGKITVAPNVVIDSAGIQALVQDVSCSTAGGFSPDGKIGDPVSNPLDSFITGGVPDIAQVTRISIIGSSTNENHGVGDFYEIKINGTETYNTGVFDVSPNDGNPDQSISDVAVSLANQISSGSSAVSATANVGGLGSIDIKARVPGIAFTTSTTHVTDQVLRITLNGTPSVTDVVTITAGGSTYSHTVTETNSLAQIATFLSLKISNTLVSSSANSNYIDIRTKSVGGLINYTGTVSSASITLSIDDRSTEFSTTTIVDNFKSNYVFSWSAAGNPSYTNNNLEIGSLPADAYTLTVSIDGLTGCSTTAGPFLIEEPSVNIGTVSETCGGTISIPISGSFTSDQMSATGNILTVNLYQGTAGAAPSYSLFDTEAYAVGSLSKTFTVTPLFTGLTPGLNYRVEVLNNTCSTPDTKNFGPISAVLEIDEDLITTSDQVCAGENDGTISVANSAVTGGTGNYSYQWTNLSLTPPVTYNVKDLAGVAPGLYELTVTDFNLSNCTVTTAGVIEIEGTSSSLSITPSSNNLLENECVGGTDGKIAISVTGAATAWIEWEYLVKTSLGTVSSSLSTSTITPNRRNLLPANFVSEESNPTGAVNSFDNLPAGIYRVKVYKTNPQVNPCAEVSLDFEITEPVPLSLTQLNNTIDPVVIQPKGVCSPDDVPLGSIQFAISGGQPPYFYSLIGGNPTEQITSTIFLRDDLPAGSYDIVISDSSGCNTNANNLVLQTIVLTDPAGGPLVLTEGSITPIPCGGGTGQFIVNTQGGYYSGSVSTTTFPVRITSSNGNYIFNTSINPGQDIVVSNLPFADTYTVAVTDESGCLPEVSIPITLVNEAASGLSANADITGVQDCASSTPSPNGPTIKLDGSISGGISPYTIKWERRNQLTLDTFSISFSGNISPTDIGILGIDIDGSTFTSSITVNNNTGVLDLTSNLASVINADPTLEAYLSGSTIIVRGQVINSTTPLSVGSVFGLTMNLTPITPTAKTVWNEVPNTAGFEVLTGLNVGYYRAVVSDSSGCGSILVGNNTQGGFVFEIDDPTQLEIKDIEFDDITCNQNTASIRFKLGNGQFDLVPDPTVFEFTLNGTTLQSTVSGGSSLSSGASSSLATNVLSGNSYTPDLNTNYVLIQNLQAGSYNMEVNNNQTNCTVLLNFEIEDLSSISYSGINDFTISACDDSYQGVFFDPFLISGGTPFLDASGQPYYSLKWDYYPDPNSTANATAFNGLSNNITFSPLPGKYNLTITDKNGCTITDASGNPQTIEFLFTPEFSGIEVVGVANASGASSTPVSCQIDAEDGTIAIDVQGENGSIPPPYEINWDVQGADLNPNEAILLFQGVTASKDSLEVYSILVNNIPFTYSTQIPNEPIESVVQELAKIVDNSPQLTAVVEPAPIVGSTQNIQIRITSVSGAAISLQIASLTSQLKMLNTTVSSANWTPLDGTNGNSNFTGFTSLNNLAEGTYRYTISSASLSGCSGGTTSTNYQFQGIITVENENVLQIRSGPTVDSALCSGQAGTIFLDVYSGKTGPLSFRYDGNPVTATEIGEDQYIIEIDNPVNSASLEILNLAGCGIARQINIGIGTPEFDYESVNSLLTGGQILAREDVTFYDRSEDEYDSFEIIFGDGNQTEVLERNQPDPITHEYAISGTYYATIRIYNDLDCRAELTKAIKVGKGYSVLSPNVFTPNGDIFNQCYKPLFNGLVEATFRVYDAQGALLYEEIGVPPTDPTKQALTLTGWCGPDQTGDEKKEIITPFFIYTLDGKTADGVEVFRDGTFILLR